MLYVYTKVHISIWAYFCTLRTAGTYSVIYKTFYGFHSICVNMYLYKSMPTCIRELNTQCSVPSLNIRTPDSVSIFCYKVQLEIKWLFHSCNQKCPSDVLEFRPLDLQKHQTGALCPRTKWLSQFGSPKQNRPSHTTEHRRWKTQETRQIVTVSLLQMTFSLKNISFPLRRKINKKKP